MAVDEVTGPQDAPAALLADVNPDNNPTKTPVDYCALYATSKE